ncbi:hypothetical protein [Aromatoleum diolicum]|uniref:Uncharacterized protein n=1 Tax=Aromatoleum diolicum TaxID=75796 RepID=A0ABX1Q935_9RHOO|nr:hypothetical protein [Aromatoleum diolicum]NMG74884.1 hypothetical protein [Aromatoleum diolicum]
MTLNTASHSSTTDRGARVALIYALVAERLSTYYEHDQWLTEAQGASLCADWLSRSKRSLPLADRKHLSALSDQLARQIAESLSREAGLYTAHEMMESLDPNHDSDIGRSLMVECQRFLDSDVAADASTKQTCSVSPMRQA